MRGLAISTLLVASSLALAGDKLTPPEGRRFQAHAGAVGTVEVSSGSRFLLTTCFSQKQSVKVFDLATRQCLLETTGWPAYFSPDGERLAVSGEKGVSVLDLKTGKKHGPFGEYGSGSLCISRDGKLVAAAYHEKVLDKSQAGNEKGWHVGVWDIASGEKKKTIDLDDGPAGAVGFAKGDKEVVCWQWVRRSNTEFETVHTAISVAVGSSRVDLQACKLEYSIVSPK